MSPTAWERKRKAKKRSIAVRRETVTRTKIEESGRRRRRRKRIRTKNRIRIKTRTRIRKKRKRKRRKRVKLETSQQPVAESIMAERETHTVERKRREAIGEMNGIEKSSHETKDIPEKKQEEERMKPTGATREENVKVVSAKMIGHERIRRTRTNQSGKTVAAKKTRNPPPRRRKRIAWIKTGRRTKKRKKLKIMRTKAETRISMPNRDFGGRSELVGVLDNWLSKIDHMVKLTAVVCTI